MSLILYILGKTQLSGFISTLYQELFALCVVLGLVIDDFLFRLRIQS